jgi:N-acetylmuramoyl-L-alanine amidase
MRLIKYIVLHCTAGSQRETIAELKAGFKARGWKNNGYHIVVDGSGIRFNITPLENIANGVAGYNSNSIHVSYMGGVDRNGKAVDNRTDAQKKQLLAIVKELKQKFPTAKICGHRDFSPDLNHNGIIEGNEWIKVCPCFDAGKEYAGI